MLRRVLVVMLASMLVVGVSAGLALATNWVEVDSYGTSNDVDVEQTDHVASMQKRNQLYIFQNGYDNWTRAVQNAWGDPWGLNYGDVRQVGDYNDALLYQDGGAGGNTIDLDQLGASNYAKIDQFIYPLGPPVNNNAARVYQSGNWNTAEIYQYAH